MTFAMIREDANVRRYDGARYQPRLHTAHHTFATERIVSWYREGRNVQDMLPVLSTYLGHTSINTAVYVSMTNELLKEAGRKFESCVLKL
jgi:integrase